MNTKAIAGIVVVVVVVAAVGYALTTLLHLSLF